MHSAPSSPRRERASRILTSVYLAAAFCALAIWLLDRLAPGLGFWPGIVFGTFITPLAPNPASIVTLFILAWMLMRRMRLALGIIIAFELLGLLAASGVLVAAANDHLGIETTAMLVAIVGLHILSLIASLAIIALGIWLLPMFPARVGFTAGLRASIVFIIGGLVTLAYAVIASALTIHDAEFGFDAVTAALLRAFSAGDPDQFDVRHLPFWVPVTISTLTAVTIFLTVYVLLRPTRTPGSWHAAQEIRLRTLLERFPGEDSLAYFATRRDRDAIFSPGDDAAVTFRQQGSHSLAGGDPLGNPAHWGQAIDGWIAHARSFGQVPVACSVSEAGARAFAARGFSIIPMGDEAIIRPQQFDLHLSGLAEVARAAKRVTRAGVTIQVRRLSELPTAELQEWGRCAERWRGGEADRGFTMALNRWGDPADADTVIVTATGAEGPVGLLSFVPVGAGLSLDVMRHDHRLAPNGITEAMVAALVGWAEEHGVDEVSLNFVMFRRVFSEAERVGRRPSVDFQSRLLGFFDRYFQLESLYRSNKKYLPDWRPRYLCVPVAGALAPAALAFSMAEGFLPEVFGRPAAGGELNDSELQQLSAALSAVRAERMPQQARRAPVTQHRIAHAEQLQAAGLPPYPIGLRAQRSLAEVGGIDAWPDEVPVSGRIRHLRRHGGVVFADLIDRDVTVQVVLERDSLDGDFAALTDALDTGDIVVVTGRRGPSRTGTPSVLATGLTPAAKALVPIPFEGIGNAEFRARHRSLDLLVNPAALRLLETRSQVMATTRRVLTERGFAEVETPVLNTVHGGATARPFHTYINAYSTPLTLRIAPELYLKRLLVAGSGPIFELSRNFRNEGADATHNPEFTSLEAYLPFSDYVDMARLTQQLIQTVATTIHGSPQLPLLTGGLDDSGTPARELTDISGDWPLVPVCEALSQRLAAPISLDTDMEILMELARDHGIAQTPTMGPGAIIEELYGELVEAETVTPTFYCDFPAETSPLTGPHRSKPGLVERWDLVINGMEVGTAYSELADPIEQRRRLTEQSWKAAHGDAEAMEVDEDFLAALEAGMPPAGGLGIGMDRLVMLMTNTTIREVLTFPFVRPRR